MAHPDVAQVTWRRKMKKAKERMLNRKSLLDILDLTPHNAIELLRNPDYEIRLK